MWLTVKNHRLKYCATRKRSHKPHTGQSSPLRRGGALCATGWSLHPTPRRSDDRHPPAPEPPTQTMFARGPVWRWAFGCTLSPVIAKGYANVENVGVRLWQSRAICLRAVRPHFPVIPAPPAQQTFCHSRAGGNRAVIVISYLIGGIILCCVFIITQSAIQI